MSTLAFLVVSVICTAVSIQVRDSTSVVYRDIRVTFKHVMCHHTVLLCAIILVKCHGSDGNSLHLHIHSQYVHSQLPARRKRTIRAAKSYRMREARTIKDLPGSGRCILSLICLRSCGFCVRLRICALGEQKYTSVSPTTLFYFDT